jgi:hypothetical protein
MFKFQQNILKDNEGKWLCIITETGHLVIPIISYFGVLSKYAFLNSSIGKRRFNVQNKHYKSLVILAAGLFL